MSLRCSLPSHIHVALEFGALLSCFYLCYCLCTICMALQGLNAHCWGCLTIVMSCWTFRSPLHLLKRRADVALFRHAVRTDICVCRLFPMAHMTGHLPSHGADRVGSSTRNNGAFRVRLWNYLCDQCWAELISIMSQPQQCHWNGPYVSYDCLDGLSDVHRIIQYIYSSQTWSYY